MLAAAILSVTLAAAAPPRPAPPAAPANARGMEVFVAPSIASLGEEWADAMAGGRIGTVADRHAWTPAAAFGVRVPVRGAALELDASAIRFSAPVPGGRTEGWVGHLAGRAALERGRLAGELGVLARMTDLSSPGGASRDARVLPSAEVSLRAASGTRAFVSVWNDPVLPYGDEGWLQAGGRREWGRLSGELALALDPILDPRAFGVAPIVTTRIEVEAGKGYRVGLSCRAADEPMAAVVVRRAFR